MSIFDGSAHGAHQEPINQIVLRRATHWVVQLNDPATSEADFIAWQTWLAESPDHARAFADVQETWRRSASVSQACGADLAALKSMQSALVAELPPARRRRIFVGWAAAAAAVLVLGIGTFVWRDASEVVATRTAEIRSIRLADGSRAALGPETRLRIHYTADTRLITMLKGQAYFEVAHSPARPFLVSTPHGVVAAVGTAFSVRSSDTRLTVTVTQGTVRVEPPQGSGSAAPVSVSADHRLVRERSTVSVESLASDSSALSWQQGRLEYQGEPLSVVVEDVNRYSPVKVVIDDPALAQMRYSGTVFPDALSVWIASIPRVFPVRVENRGGKYVLVADPPSAHP